MLQDYYGLRAAREEQEARERGAPVTGTDGITRTRLEAGHGRLPAWRHSHSLAKLAASPSTASFPLQTTVEDHIADQPEIRQSSRSEVPSEELHRVSRTQKGDCQ